MDVGAWRRDTRARLIEARQQIPPSEHHRASSVIVSLLEDVLGKLPPQILSAYWPFKAEVDLRDLLGHLQDDGWRTSLPAVVRPRAPLEFLLWTRDSQMDEGVYGIPVPRDRHPVIPTIVVIPLVAFDAMNYRLGYGGGFFDRTLAAMDPRPRTIGVGFELCRLGTIYPSPQDIPLDLIVTETGVQGTW